MMNDEVRNDNDLIHQLITLLITFHFSLFTAFSRSKSVPVFTFYSSLITHLLITFHLSPFTCLTVQTGPGIHLRRETP